MQVVLISFLVIVSILLIGLVLLQHGKGADIGAAFGSGASNTVFGSQGSASFLMKMTAVLAALFFIICIVLTNLATRSENPKLHIKPLIPSPPAVPSVPAKENKSGTSSTLSAQRKKVPDFETQSSEPKDRDLKK